MELKNLIFYDIYGGFFDLQEKFITFFYNFFEFSDYFKFLYIIIYYKLNTSNLTLQDILDESTLSQSAKKAIDIFSITINDIPSQTNINDFCGTISINTQGIKQFKDPNLWHVLVENKLKKLNNVNIYKNTQIIKILQKNNKIYAVETQDNQKLIVINYFYALNPIIFYLYLKIVIQSYKIIGYQLIICVNGVMKHFI